MKRNMTTNEITEWLLVKKLIEARVAKVKKFQQHEHIDLVSKSFNELSDGVADMVRQFNEEAIPMLYKHYDNVPDDLYIELG